MSGFSPGSVLSIFTPMALLCFSVRRWRWTVFTEFNNYDWLQGSNTSFMRLYDHTVCGLREAIGREGKIG